MEGPRPVRDDERELWCACPQRPGEQGYERWLEGERAWLRQWDTPSANLFVFERDGAFVGKFDVPIEKDGKWEMWAPTVRDGPDAAGVMESLCRHVPVAAGERGIVAIELILEGAHPQFVIARAALEAAGFTLTERRRVFRRDLSLPLPAVDVPGLTFRPVADLAHEEFLSLGRRVEAMETPARGVAAVRGNDAVGMALVAARPGERLFTLHHFGVVEEERGRGVGTALLRETLRQAHDDGFSVYVGSTAAANAAMLRIFGRLGCEPVGDRMVYGRTVH